MVSPHDFFFVFLFFFCYDFFQNYLCRFFFNIKLVENYNYNKTKSCGENIVAFLTKHRGLLQCRSTWFFFLMIFFKIVFVDFIFLILSWLRITITSKAKLYREAL